MGHFEEIWRPTSAQDDCGAWEHAHAAWLFCCAFATSGDRRLSHNARLDLLNKFQAGSLAAVVSLSHFVSEEEKCHLGLVTSNPEVCRHAQ